MKPKKTEAEKKKALIEKMKASLERKPQNSFNCSIAKHEPLSTSKFTSGLFRSN